MVDVVSKILDNLYDQSDEDCANIIYGAYMSNLVSKEQMLELCHKYGIVSVEDFWGNDMSTCNSDGDIDPYEDIDIHEHSDVDDYYADYCNNHDYDHYTD